MTQGPFFDLGHGITLIDAGYHRPGMVGFYLLTEKGSAAVIDTGTGHSLPALLEALAARGLGPDDVAYVIPTHVHLDHAGGAGEMMRRFPRATLVVHPRGARHLIDPSALKAGVNQVYGAERAEREFGTPVPVPAERVVEAPDNYTLLLNGRELLFLDTPGHARHHFCVIDARSGAIFSGDTFGLSYREFVTARGAFVLPTTTPVQFEPERLHASIERLRGYKPKQILLTHFGRVTDVERLAGDLHELIDAFVDLGQRLRDAGSERQRLLVEGQHALVLPRLRAHGCELPEPEIERLLRHDYDLNAQGIGVWLERAAAGAR